MGGTDGRAAARWRRVQSTGLALGVLVCLGATEFVVHGDVSSRAVTVTLARSAGAVSTSAVPAGDLPGTTGVVREERLSRPDRVVVRDDLGVVATFTVAARTVTVRGAQRTFAESTTSATVTGTAWVRLLGDPFAGAVDYGWLGARLTDTSPDVLEVAGQYVTGAPQFIDASGFPIAGDASYGPLLADGTREEGSDFNDYLGVAWSYGDTVDRPEERQHGALDCSGYVRMVFGYRAGVPLALQADGAALPRRAVQMNESAPGVMAVPYTGKRPKSLDALLPGDLVLFDASTDDGTAIDHVGLYLGVDSAGDPRFLSSRKGADGPTMGDIRGRSTLSGTGLYATSFRSARRL